MKKINFLVLFLFAFHTLILAQGVQSGVVGNFVSTANSSTATLTSGSTFTGTSEDISKYAEIRINVISDVASATNGLSMQQSSDGTNWDHIDAYTVAAATGKEFGVPVYGKHFRIVYTNGGTNQASFRLQAVYHTYATTGSSVRPQDARSNDSDMPENLTYGMAYDPILNVWNRVGQDLFYTGQAAQTATVNNIIPSTVSASATDLLGYKSGAVQIIAPAGTYTTGAIIFEGSNDNTNFQTIPVYSQLITTGTPITAAITLVTTTSLIYTFPITARYIRIRISTTVSGASASVQAISVFSKTAWTPAFFQVAQATAANLNVTATGTVATTMAANATTTPAKAEDAVAGSADTGIPALAVRNDALTSNAANLDYQHLVSDAFGHLLMKDQQRQKRTYRTAFVVTPAVTPTDVFQLIGSATTTVEITKIIVSGTMTTGGLVDVYISKRSTANSGGTSSGTTMVPMISTDAAATAVGAIYTANPTPGSAVGDIYIESIPIATITDKTNNIIEINFGEVGKFLILSGVAQTVVLRLNGATVTGLSLKVTVEFCEY